MFANKRWSRPDGGGGGVKLLPRKLTTSGLIAQKVTSDACHDHLSRYWKLLSSLMPSATAMSFTTAENNDIDVRTALDKQMNFKGVYFSWVQNSTVCPSVPLFWKSFSLSNENDMRGSPGGIRGHVSLLLIPLPPAKQQGIDWSGTPHSRHPTGGGGKEMLGESAERWTACERLSPSANCSLVPRAPGESSELAVVDGGKGFRG